MTVEGIPVTASSIEFAYMASRILEAMGRAPEKVSALEIGGGYGGLARALGEALYLRRYLMVDFDPMLKLAEFYLEGNSFLSRPEYWYITPDRLFGDPMVRGLLESGFDLVINTRSLGEMPEGEIKRYLTIIEQTIRPGGVFYCVNHAETRDRPPRIGVRDWPLSDKWAISREVPYPVAGNRMKEYIMRWKP
jgi:putative sugar O-methyltransferase